MASSSPPAPPSPRPRPRLPPPIWSHDETLALIESYRQKWHSLGCANLRSANWDDVASDLSCRSSLLPSSSPKTSVQCRHKIEKLRKRFRSDRRRSLTQNPQSPPFSTWPFFPLMESLDHPPIPNAELLRFVIPKAVRSKVVNPKVTPAFEEMRRRLERKRKEMELGTADGMMVAMRTVGDGFMRMERVKLDMVRERERTKMEMELKRTEMILDSQQQIVDAFVKGFVGGRRKRGKVSPDSRISDV